MLKFCQLETKGTKVKALREIWETKETMGTKAVLETKETWKTKEWSETDASEPMKKWNTVEQLASQLAATQIPYAPNNVSTTYANVELVMSVTKIDDVFFSHNAEITQELQLNLHNDAMPMKSSEHVEPPVSQRVTTRTHKCALNNAFWTFANVTLDLFVIQLPDNASVILNAET